MAETVLVLGASGSGKTTSLRNFKSGEVLVFETAGKRLPFKNNWGEKYVQNNLDYDGIKHVFERAEQNKDNAIKTYIIDDSQYLMAFDEFGRANQNGYDKFTKMAVSFYNLLRYIGTELPSDWTVYLLSHTDVDENGKTHIKTIGKMLDTHITIEGLFNTVLLAHVNQGKYTFLTHNLDGTTTVKSPIGMFADDEIPNDLKAVDDTIRDYYGIQKEGAK